MCHFSSYWGGGVPAILDIIYVFFFYDMKARQKASLLTATRKLENIFPSLPSRFAPLSSPGWRVCPHFCWDKSSCVSGLS